MFDVALVKRADWLVVCDEDMTVHSDAVLAVDGDGNVLYAGARREAPQSVRDVAATVASEPGSVILPGFVNSHAHTAMAILRSAGDGLPIDQWLNDCIWPAESRLTDEDAYHGTVVGISEMLASGIVASAEMYRHEQAVSAAFIDMGMRAVVAPTIFGRNVDRRLEAIDNLRSAMSSEPLIEVVVGLHAIYSCGVETCRHAFAHAAATGMATHIHLSETAGEARNAEGVSAVDTLVEAGMLKAELNAAHGILLDERDIATLAASDHHVGISHCPVSNMNVGGGVAADILRLLDGGITVGIGTDGPGSAGQLDMFESMRSALLNARHMRADPTALTAETVLQAATVGSARTAGVAGGTLEAGQPADFLVMRTSEGTAPARFAGRLELADEIVAAIVWQGRPEDINEVWIGGKLAAAQDRASRNGLASADIEPSITHVNKRRPELLT